MSSSMGAWRWIGAVWLTVLSGCSSDHDRATAEESLHKWQAKGPQSYVYLLATECLCLHRGTVRVVVVDGLVTSAIDLDSGDAVPGKTMTELLQSVVTEASHDNDDFEATYDAKLGYLKHLSVDHTSASDDEYSKTVRCFGEGISDDICAG
jgi:Family of unknown function (DUF6174)